MYTRAGSAEPLCIALSTAAASARMGEMMDGPGTPAAGGGWPRPGVSAGAGSAEPLCIALSTAAASARRRESMSGPGTPAAAITCQPASRVQFCHCRVSLGSSSATAGVFVWAAGGLFCPASGQPRSRLIVAQARTNSFGQFLDIICLLERRHGENVAIVLLQLHLQLFGQIRQFGGILQVLLVLGLEDFFFLRLAVGQNDVFLIVGPAAPAAAPAALLL